MPSPATRRLNGSPVAGRAVASLFAARAEDYTPSPIRAIFDLPLGPDDISLAGGNPDLSGLPWPELARLTDRILLDHGEEALQYGATTGRLSLARAIVGEVMAAEGIEADPRELIVTSGSQMSLNLIAGLFLDPGDTVLTELPTYVGALHAFAGFQATVRQLPRDTEGVRVDALVAAIRAAADGGGRAKLLYVIPNFGNPTGMSMSEARRREVAQICVAEGLLIVEDDPYGLIRFAGQRAESLRMMAPEIVIHLGSMSKIFSPGLRVGWADAPAAVHERLVLAAESVTICPSVLGQFLAEAFLRELDWRAIVGAQVQRYRSRAGALMAGLERAMPEGVSWTRPEGGFFTWLSLPDGVDSAELMGRGIERGVLFVPGAAFHVDPAEGRSHLRLSFSSASEERLGEAARRLGALIAG